MAWFGISKPAVAQIADSTLGGRVVDSSGEGVAEARVFARREGTKERRSVRADEEGFFLFPPLPPGDWDVEASAKGFTTAVVGEVRISAAQTRRLDLELEPSEAQEMVSTVDYVPLVRTGPELVDSVDDWELADLPLRERSVAELSRLDVLAAESGPDEIRLDGGLVAEPFTPPLSSLRHATLLSASYGVEFSGSAGVVSLVTHTGTPSDSGSGSAFVLHRDEDLDAVDSRTHTGVSWGGPVGPQTSRRGTHAFVDAEAVSGDWPDERSLLAKLSRHDRRNLLRLRHLRRDPELAGRLDSLLFGWQTSPATSVIHDMLIQLDDAAGTVEFDSAFDRRLQLRSDLYVTASSGSGLHDLAFGVESVSTEFALASTDEWSFYGRDRWQVSDRLRLTGGLRAELFEDEDGRTDRLAPRGGLVWRLSRDGSHLLRGGAGRFFDAGSQRSRSAEAVEVDQLSLGWSWQISPFLGLSLDALSGDSDVATMDRESLALTVRSRFGDTFRVRASFSWTEPHRDVADGTRDRAVVTGLYRAPADVLVAAVYRNEPEDAEPGGFDLSVAKRVSVSGDVSLELLAEVFDVFEEQAAGGGRAGQLGLRLSF